MLRHQASTWELLHVLFSAIEGEKPARQGQRGGGAGEDAAMEEGEEPQLDRLAAFKRRAQLRCGYQAGAGGGPGGLGCLCWRPWPKSQHAALMATTAQLV